MIQKFLLTSFEDPQLRGVDQGELIRMHGYPHVIPLHQIADPSQLRFKMILPVKPANRMRGEGNQVRGDPEKQDIMLMIELEHLK